VAGVRQRVGIKGGQQQQQQLDDTIFDHRVWWRVRQRGEVVKTTCDLSRDVYKHWSMCSAREPAGPKRVK
jgi:hypothetical protein